MAVFGEDLYRRWLKSSRAPFPPFLVASRSMLLESLGYTIYVA